MGVADGAGWLSGEFTGATRALTVSWFDGVSRFDAECSFWLAASSTVVNDVLRGM